MKKRMLIIFCIPFFLPADEGMWLPHLLESLIFDKMKSKGLKISAETIYSVNRSSMKDAVMLFGRGCTAEAISPHGLIITNHHCGYSTIVQASTPEKNYLKKGFWARQRSEEIPCPGLTVTFIRKIENVSEKILGHIPESFRESQKDSLLEIRIRQLEKEYSSSSGLTCIIKPFYYGSEYYLFYTEVFRDVRLVGTPEEAIGKFGGETDNWIWPRHNPDFCVYRIYAGKDNKPADYSPDNVPYRPRWFFPISLKPLKENDFTMVYGFPGLTQEYLSSHAVQYITQFLNPLKIKLRELRLKVYENYMKNNDTLTLRYADRYASIANYYKKMKGESHGIEQTHAIDTILQREARLRASVSDQPEKVRQLDEMMKRFRVLYKELELIQKQWEYYFEGLYGIDLFRFVIQFKNLLTEMEKKKRQLPNQFEQVRKELRQALPLRNYDKRVDMELFRLMMQTYEENIEPGLRPRYLDSVLVFFGKDYKKMADFFYSQSLFTSHEGIKKMLDEADSHAEIILRDPYYNLVFHTSEFYQKNIATLMQIYDIKIQSLQKEYMKFQKENNRERVFYPDANGTLRIAFGQIRGMKPRDGVEYQWYSTVQGMLEKNRTGHPDYAWTPRMEEMVTKNQFGKYARSASEFRISFIASNHTTGGNSGSPVLNAYGHLIGINYDRCWESTMSDLFYHKDRCRNITLDANFMLWYIDLYAGASHLLKEMKIVR